MPNFTLRKEQTISLRSTERFNSVNFMKITICGSVASQDKILSLKGNLEKLGHEVKIWPLKVKNGEGQLISVEEYYKIRQTAANDEKWVWDRKAEAIMKHFNKVARSDAIFVANYDKNDIKGYIGGNTLMEIGLAFFLKKKIYLLNQIPELPYKEEILGVKPIILYGDLSKIK